MPNIEDRQSVLEKYNFVCSCLACLKDYKHGVDFFYAGPDFERGFIPLLREQSDITSKAIKLANELLKNFGQYRAGNKKFGPKEFEFVFRIFTGLHDWPIISKKLLLSF
jgi:hypothetical protein